MKFSIRDIMFVSGIVALAVGWGLDHWRQAREKEMAKETIESLLSRR